MNASYFRKILKEKIKEQQEVLTKLHGAYDEVKFIRRPQRILFRVYLDSCWADEGEKNHVEEGFGPLDALIRRAEKHFMEINSRSDVQATYRVFGVFNGVEIPVDQRYIELFKKKR